MEAKTGKDLEETIQKIHNDEQYQSMIGTDSYVVYVNNTAYYINGDIPTSDFNLKAEFLMWRLSVLGVEDLCKELDVTEYDLFEEMFEAIGDEWTDDWLDELLTDCYGMEKI